MVATSGAPAIPCDRRRDTAEVAFDTLYRDHYALVWRCLRRMGVADEAAEDALQEVFVTAYRRLHTYEGRASLRAWLLGITRRVAFRARRSYSRRARREDALGRIPAEVEDLEQWFRRREAESFLAAFLDGLDDDKRAVFVLQELEGLPGRDVAQALGLNPNTAAARLRAVRALFARACARVHADGFEFSAEVAARVHADDEPHDAVMLRGWAAIGVQLAAASSTIGSAASATSVGASAAMTTVPVASLAVHAKAILITVALGGVGIVTAARVVDATETERSTASVVDADAAPVESSASPPRMPVLVPATAAARDPATPASTPTPLEEPAGSPEKQSQTHSDPPPDPLEHELELVDLAKRAADAGRFDVSLATAQRYLATHSEGRLRFEAVALVVAAHCRLGSPERAATEATARIGTDAARRLIAEKCRESSAAVTKRPRGGDSTP